MSKCSVCFTALLTIIFLFVCIFSFIARLQVIAIATIEGIQILTSNISYLNLIFLK